MSEWLEVQRGDAPLILTFPHTGTAIPTEIERSFVSPWLARKDADWWIERLYDFAADMGATTIRTTISRSVIDVNRDPSGASLYPGQATTDLCPTTSFDGEQLYLEGFAPNEDEIALRREAYFLPYHDAIEAEIERLRKKHGGIVLYDCHSIRSFIPRLFDGILPQFNIGTFDGKSCDPELADGIANHAAASPYDHVVNGRFKGGWTTRHYGRPEKGVHAVQMELSCRGYIDEPIGPIDGTNWPSPYIPARAEPLRAVLEDMLGTCLKFAEGLR